MTAPEFSRPHRVDRIGAGDSSAGIEADSAERAALAERFDLVEIESLRAHYKLHRDAAGIRATGHLSAQVTQRCVVTAAPLPASVDEDFAILFLQEPGEGSDEIELSEEDCDTVFYTGGTIDLGEAAAETLALALDPFPRSPEAETALKAAGVLSEEEAGPFGALAALKDKLKG